VGGSVCADAGGTRLLLEWVQAAGLLLSAGSVPRLQPVVRVWDVERELCVSSIPISHSMPQAVASVSALCSDPSGCHMLAVGFSDGWLHVLDPRDSSRSASVAAIAAHTGPVSQVCLRSSGSTERLVTCSVGGSVNLFDLRRVPSVREVHRSTNITSLAGHLHQDVVAIGSRRQNVKLFDLSRGKRITIKGHSDFWGTRLGGVTCLKFHPSQALLALGATNDTLSVFPYSPNAWTEAVAFAHE